MNSSETGRGFNPAEEPEIKPQPEPDSDSEREIVKLTSQGPEWVERLENARTEELEDARNIFGNQLLNNWEIKNKKGPGWEKIKNAYSILGNGLIERAERQFHEGLPKIRAELRKLVELLPMEVGEMFTEYFLSQSEKYDPLQAINQAMQLIELMKTGTPIKETALVKILELHRKRVIEKEQQLQPEIDALKNHVQQLFLSAEGLKIIKQNPEVIKERLDNVECVVVDALTAKLDERYGDYLSTAHRIRLATNMPKDLRQHVFVHESLHAVSGQTEFEELVLGYDGTEYVHNSRVGLRFGGMGTREIGPEIKKNPADFRWLNEGVTEWLTLELTKEQDSTIYSLERELVARLIAGGLPEELLTAAYFENYAVRPAGEHRNPALKRLFTETNKVFGKGFLTNLSLYLEELSRTEKSRQYAMAKIIGYWDAFGLAAFPGFIESWAESRDYEENDTENALDPKTWK